MDPNLRRFLSVWKQAVRSIPRFAKSVEKHTYRPRTCRVFGSAPNGWQRWTRTNESFPTVYGAWGSVEGQKSYVREVECVFCEKFSKCRFPTFSERNFFSFRAGPESTAVLDSGRPGLSIENAFSTFYRKGKKSIFLTLEKAGVSLITFLLLGMDLNTRFQ